MSVTTIFTWGYWGWGNATEQLIEAVDAVERSRGFEPPMFVDIRIHRSVRAVGFRDDAFESVVGPSRYRWMKSLGNRGVLQGYGPQVQIDDPGAADALLDLALAAAARRERVLFFCSCEFPGIEGDGGCHRVTIARLVLEAAGRRNVPIEIVEWPGGDPTEIETEISSADFRSLRGRKSVPLSPMFPGEEYAGAPWGSIVTACCGKDRLLLVTGPAKFRAKGWYLPRMLDITAPPSETAQLRREAGTFRKDMGFAVRSFGRHRAHSTSDRTAFAYCIYTIVHPDKLKQVAKQGGAATFSEARPWKTGYQLLREANRIGLPGSVLI